LVGIVLVSHSFELAHGLAALTSQLAGNEVRVEPAGGGPNGTLGTTDDTVRSAIKRADAGQGVVALHARPAATFVKTALRFRSRVMVGVNGKVADAKSILAVLALGATGGTMLRLSADGDDASAALDALAGCVSGLTE